MKSILKRIRYIKIILDLITIYLFTIGFVGVVYAFKLIDGHKFSAEMLSYKYFFSTTNIFFEIFVMFWSLWIIFYSIYLGNFIYLKHEVVETRIVKINYLQPPDPCQWLEKDERKGDLREIEHSLLSDEKSFGLLCVMGHYDPKTDSDVDEYLLCTAMIRRDNHFKNGKSVFIGCDAWILKDKEIIVTAQELVNVFNIFRKCKRELICDLYAGIGEFDISEYVDRLKKLDI